MLHFILGKAGCGKTHALYEILKSQNLGNTALMVVPEQASFETERTMLSLPEEQRCEVFSFTRLCHRVFQTYGGIAGTPITGEEKVLLMARSVEEAGEELKLYRKQAKRVEFLNHLLTLVAECRFKGITPAPANDRRPCSLPGTFPKTKGNCPDCGHLPPPCGGRV